MGLYYLFCKPWVTNNHTQSLWGGWWSKSLIPQQKHTTSQKNVRLDHARTSSNTVHVNDNCPWFMMWHAQQAMRKQMAMWRLLINIAAVQTNLPLKFLVLSSVSFDFRWWLLGTLAEGVFNCNCPKRHAQASFLQTVHQEMLPVLNSDLLLQNKNNITSRKTSSMSLYIQQLLFVDIYNQTCSFHHESRNKFMNRQNGHLQQPPAPTPAPPSDKGFTKAEPDLMKCCRKANISAPFSNSSRPLIPQSAATACPTVAMVEKKSVSENRVASNKWFHVVSCRFVWRFGV